MRRKPYLSLLLALVILGGMLALFPTAWMLLGIVLLALVTLQVILVQRNLYRLPPGQTSLDYPPPREATPAKSGAAQARSAPAAAGTATGGGAPAAAPDAAAPPTAAAAEEAAPAQTPPAAPEAPGSGRPNIEPELFSRFRKHLEQAESEASGKAAPRGTPPPIDPAEVEDRVELSGAARRPAAARRPPAGAPPGAPAGVPPARAGSKPPAGRAEAEAAEAAGADLFEDLRPAPPPAPPPSPQAAPPVPPAASGSPAADAPAPRPTTAAETARDAAQQPPTAPLAAPPARPAPVASRPAAGAAGLSGDEVSAALAHREGDAPGLADEAAAVLHMADEAAAREDWQGLRAGLDNYLAHLADAPGLIHWRARRLQARLAVHEGDSNRALQSFEEMLSAGYRTQVDAVPALLEGLLAGAERDAAASLRVSMLVRILAGFRQSRDQRAMDRCYGWIEEAQEQVGDERRLLQYLRNHLEIRKVLGDVPGQLELIDQLGNRCYRLGLTEEAKAYYEMGLRLRGQSDDDAAPAAPPPGSAREG